MLTIPNCYFLQSHLSDVLGDWSEPIDYFGIYDTYTFPSDDYAMSGCFWLSSQMHE